MTPLTDSQKESVLADFIQWSDGLHPRDCFDHEIETYVTHAASADLDEQAVRTYLVECSDSQAAS